MRLSRARQQLLVPNDATSVTSVAVAHGFSQLGRFAAQYRQQFGELPSETLAAARRKLSNGVEELDDEALRLSWRALASAFMVGPGSCSAALADAEQIRKRRDKLARDSKTGAKDAVAEDAALAKIEHAIAEGRLAIHAGLSPEEAALVKHLNLLTMKPILYALNKKSGGHNLDELADGRAARAYDFIAQLGGRPVVVDAATERELNDVADEDRTAFREELGALEDGLAGVIRGAYDTLGLISFFTTGPKETRAWTIARGATAPEAGAAIHTDFKDKFIRAEVVSTEALVAAGSWNAARETAKVRTEGKEYVVHDGDVMVFLHG